MDDDIDIGWGEAKAEINLLVHGIPFPAARSVLRDPGRLVVARGTAGAPAGSGDAFTAVGLVDGRAITVAAEEDETGLRLLSARPATAAEWRAVARLDGVPTGAPTLLPPELTVRLDGLSAAEIRRNADADPDNPPLRPDEVACGVAARRVRAWRRSTGLSRIAFARQFRLDPVRLAEWESGRSRPDPASLAYLAVIRHDPAAVRRALAAEPGA